MSEWLARQEPREWRCSTVYMDKRVLYSHLVQLERDADA
jgi:hypothetical protein